MRLEAINSIAVSGQVLEFTVDGSRFKVTGYVPDESDERPGAVRCPTERCHAQCCASSYCGSAAFPILGTSTEIRPGKSPNVKEKVLVGRCPALDDGLKCSMYKSKPLGGWLFPLTEKDHEAYPLCELRVVRV